MLTYNTIYSYSTIFYTLLPYTRIVYYSLAILLYTGILGLIWKKKEKEEKIKKEKEKESVKHYRCKRIMKKHK